MFTILAGIAAEAVKLNPNYHVCLGGGTKIPIHRNIDYFSECVNEIRNRDINVPIWIEMVPPDSDDDISKLIGFGATSFGFNIEFWDDSIRKKICPLKSNITKKRYLEAMKTALKLLGPNRVGSCLIIGLEPIENSIEGAISLASIGVQPCIIPFKPWDKSQYEKCPSCNSENLIKVSQVAVASMIENGINPDKNEGCLFCEGCTIDHDIYKMEIKRIGG